MPADTRPPVLAADTAQKLLDIADELHATLVTAAKPAAQEASLASPDGLKGL